MTFEQLIIELTQARPNGKNGNLVGRCPTHNDRNPSLSIKFRGEDAPLLKCHAGCDFKVLKNYFIQQNAWPKRKGR